MIKTNQHKSANILNFLTMSRISSELISRNGMINGLSISNTGFIDFFRELNKRGIVYILTGPIAKAFHGVTRPCSKIELWVSSEEQNIRKLDQHYNLALNEAGEASSKVRIGIEETLLSVHLNLNYFKAKDFNWCLHKAEEAILEGVCIPILNLDDLIVETIADKDPDEQKLAAELERLNL